MNRISIRELEHRCQKPDHRRLGNWMARRIGRPVALRITWVVAPWGVSANLATLVAWATGVATAVAFGWGSIWGWVLGAVLLQLWYLLDHVDGQLARLQGTTSLDGTQLDYLMHHTVNLIVPLGIGWGLFVCGGEPLWAAGGLLWGIATLLITLHHDARYKAFVQRLKRVRGRLEVCGGGGARPEPTPPVPRGPLRLAAWAARKACEIHVVLNLLALIALGQLLAGDGRLLAGRLYLAAMAPIAAAVACWTLVRSHREDSAEREFAAWYRLPMGCELTYCDGWWSVQTAEDREAVSDGGQCDVDPRESS
jgi:phosphatidylglycerophosphate synthase